MEGRKCEFYNPLKGMILRSIYFISVDTVSTLGKLIQKFVGEAATVR